MESKQREATEEARVRALGVFITHRDGCSDCGGPYNWASKKAMCAEGLRLLDVYYAAAKACFETEDSRTEAAFSHAPGDAPWCKLARHLRAACRHKDDTTVEYTESSHPALFWDASAMIGEQAREIYELRKIVHRAGVVLNGFAGATHDLRETLAAIRKVDRDV